uniref:protein-tyrosine-phosphatase n=1 Tax=Otus sunia TaxID=257818 RepID=A0A8C8B8N4_9STRI
SQCEEAENIGCWGGTLCAGAPLKWFTPLLPTCWHAITSCKFSGWFLLPAPSHVSSLQAGCALPRAVEQFHYQLWPDHGVPRNPAQLLCLVEMVNKRVLEAPAGPVLVHCSAGIGRTGTFIALDFLLKMGKAEGKVDVFQCVQRLREQRVSMVQTKVRSYLTCLDESSLQVLQKFSELFQLLPCREAEKPSNQPKNRKPGILPGTTGRAGQPLALQPST